MHHPNKTVNTAQDTRGTQRHTRVLDRGARRTDEFRHRQCCKGGFLYSRFFCVSVPASPFPKTTHVCYENMLMYCICISRLINVAYKTMLPMLIQLSKQ